MNRFKSCSIGLWNETVPGIEYNDDGISNFARLQYKMMELYPRGEKGKADWEIIVSKVKMKAGRNNYDCIVGVSGGVDSSYLLYLLKVKYGLKPLAVMLDNGWNSEIAVRNIKLITSKLNIDLETYVIDYEEIKDLIKSYMLSGLPWIDTPTDTAIKAVMYKIALKVGVKYIFRGNDFRTEGKQPREWTYSDDRQLNYIHKKFGKINKLKTYPFLPFWKIIYSGYFRNIKDIRPYYYLDYSKKEAKIFLENEYGWQYYGGHHHENLFTKFVMSYWLPLKFGIDKRIINLSAQIISGEITKDEAKEIITKPALIENEMEELKNYVIKKLDFKLDEFTKIMLAPNKSYHDYPNYENLLNLIIKFLNPLIRLVYDQKPMTFIEMEMKRNR